MSNTQPRILKVCPFKKKKKVEVTTSNIVNSAVNALNSIYTRAGNLVAK